MSVIWEVNVEIRKTADGLCGLRSVEGFTKRRYDTEAAAQAAYVDAVKQLGGKQ